MLTTLILVIHTIIAAALVGVILLQRSEGGALGIGAGPSGMMTARGAANLLTRATSWLAAAFIGTSILLAVLHSQGSGIRKIDPNLSAAATAPAADVPGDPTLAPVIPANPAAAKMAPDAETAAEKSDAVPLAQ